MTTQQIQQKTKTKKKIPELRFPAFAKAMADRGGFSGEPARNATHGVAGGWEKKKSGKK